MKHYDVIVIGSGPGGYVAAEHAGKHGLKTLCIEAENFGGVCLNKGCIPTKTLLKSSKLNQEVIKAVEFGVDGIDLSSITLNWEKIQARKNDVVKKLVMGVQGILKTSKCDVIKGFATLIDKNTVKVNDETITFDNLILATGSSARKFSLPGFEQGYASGRVVTSDEALSLSFIPKKFTVIGGGVIGVEFAILFAELGSEVTILQGVDRILEVLDNDISVEITNLLKKKGVNIETNVNIKEFKDNKVYYEKDGQLMFNESDVCLTSVGRKPNTDIVKPLGMELAPNGSIISDDQMRTSIKNIYAIGDCTSKIMLAHSAYKNAIVAVDTILNRHAKMDLNKVPSCIYTHPEVASIGKTEEQLIKENADFVKAKYPMSYIGKALADGESIGFIKMLVDKKTGEILGCHIVGNDASNLIAEIALAMETEATVNTLVETIHPHPTISEVVWEVAKKILLDNFKDKQWY